LPHPGRISLLDFLAEMKYRGEAISVNSSRTETNLVPFGVFSGSFPTALQFA
jgi:hypothetical protein